MLFRSGARRLAGRIRGDPARSAADDLRIPPRAHDQREAARPRADRSGQAGCDDRAPDVSAAEAEAAKQNWPMAIAGVDTAGNLVAYSKADNTQIFSVKISQAKAGTAVGMKRPTKALQDALAKGAENLRLLSFEGVALAEGGIPLVANGAIIGAIGVSGMASDQDGQVAAAGAAVIK